MGGGRLTLTSGATLLLFLGVSTRGAKAATCAEHFRQIGPNGLKIKKETTHFIVRWTRVASMA